MPHQAKLKYYSNLIIFIITFFFWELLKFYLSVFFFSNLPRSKTTTDHFTLGLSINSIRYQVASTAGRSILEFHTGFNFPVIVTNKRDRLKRQALPSNIGTNIRTSNNKKALTYLHHSLIVACWWWDKNVKWKANDYSSLLSEFQFKRILYKTKSDIWVRIGKYYIFLSLVGRTIFLFLK